LTLDSRPGRAFCAISCAASRADRLTSEEFHPENYKDEYRIRVLGMLDEKSKGKEIVIDTAPAPKHGQVIDIMEALKRSMERVPAKKNPQARPLRRERGFPKIGRPGRRAEILKFRTSFIHPFTRQLQPVLLRFPHRLEYLALDPRDFDD
jgi:hypothetical protein